MIDINCHILDRMDDGPTNLEASLAMAKEAVRQGIDTVVAAPHHMNGKYHNFAMEIKAKVKQLNEKLQEENIQLTVLPGQQTRVFGDILKSMNQGHIQPVNDTTDYILLELPSNHIPQYTRQLLFDLQIRGFKPIIVHPEKNQLILEQPNEVYELVKKGALIQLSAASLIGDYGRKVKSVAYQLIEANLAHFIGSEAHSFKNYPFEAAIVELKKRYGNSAVYYFLENAKLMTNGESVLADEPLRMKSKKILGII